MRVRCWYCGGGFERPSDLDPTEPATACDAIRCQDADLRYRVAIQRRGKTLRGAVQIEDPRLTG